MQKIHKGTNLIWNQIITIQLPHVGWSISTIWAWWNVCLHRPSANSPYFIWCVMMLNFKEITVTTVEDINSIHCHNRAGSKLILTAESKAPPGVNCSLVGKTESHILCQGVTQCRLETSMKTQVTDAVLVKAGGVHFGMTVSEWSINLQKEKRPKRSDEQFGQLPPRQPSTHHGFCPLIQALQKCSCVPFAARSSAGSELRFSHSPQVAFKYLWERLMLISPSILRPNSKLCLCRCKCETPESKPAQ